MNVAQDELDGLARAFLRIHQGNARAAAALRRGDIDGAAEAIEEERGRAWRAMNAAIRAGARRPAELPTERGETPLHLMASPANRRLLSALRDAAEAAEVVDRERGDFPDGLAEVIGHFAAGVAEEVEGPRGRD